MLTIEPTSHPIRKTLPVLMCYIAMGFVDIVGVSTGYAQRDFNLSPELAQLIPSMVFVWFFVLSVPVAVFQHHLGKRKALILGVMATAVGMFLPFLHYSYTTLLFSFLLLGVGNTIIQVASNPLLKEVVATHRFSSYMSLSQFVKAISSLLGPVIVTLMVAQFGNWKLVFFVYGVVSVALGMWLLLTPIPETQTEVSASFRSSLLLLKNPLVLFMTLSIFLIVGLDVGMNTNIQNLLVEKFGLSLEKASLGISVYFFALMISRFAGAMLLVKLDNARFLNWSAVLTALSVLFLMCAPTSGLAMASIVLMGIFSGNLFPLVFSLTLNRMPARANEISGLMTMAVVGGAVIPPVMGLINQAFGVSASFVVLLICALYVFSTTYLFKKTT
ncbi:Fucose permease [Catalinimonas alkaloidigena]|uniref:Fucose permease n=1 Tax=Catalinimonas alkaloidigena TaxID=1075417 RepID=A0A1G9TQF5_9BACT|nr:MFS transporter [Catalinimonas alkaloidigena]SDM49335.1 Fucose permease [Catalinimonas alkaloidigena]